MFNGIIVPNFGDYSDPRTLAELAHEAEESGWDGFFVFDHMLSGDMGIPVADPWIALAAIAMHTSRIRIGPMVTPLSRRRPWKVARETATLDRLSNGRLILGVGIGGPPDREFGSFGEVTDARERAAKLDEGLDILLGLWSGGPFTYRGRYYQIENALFLPRPVQRPRIPIWVGAKWRNKAPLRRAAKWDGVFPVPHDDEPITPEDLRDLVAYVATRRTNTGPFDVVLADRITVTDGTRTADSVAAYEEAGLNWWIQRVGHPWVGALEDTRRQVRGGPPRPR